MRLNWSIMKEKGIDSDPDEIQSKRSIVTGCPLNCMKVIRDTMNEARTIVEASVPLIDLGNFLPPRLVIKKPTSGKTGISHAN